MEDRFRVEVIVSKKGVNLRQILEGLCDMRPPIIEFARTTHPTVRETLNVTDFRKTSEKKYLYIRANTTDPQNYLQELSERGYTLRDVKIEELRKK